MPPLKQNSGARWAFAAAVGVQNQTEPAPPPPHMLSFSFPFRSPSPSLFPFPSLLSPDCPALPSFLFLPPPPPPPNSLQDCYNTAFFLKGVIERLLPCTVKVMKTAANHMPIVFARLRASKPNRPTVVIYGHYDVVDVNPQRGQWDTDPFEMEGRDGYYYGRGTTDNKGPTMAVIHALYELVEEVCGAVCPGAWGGNDPPRLSVNAHPTFLCL